MSEEKSLKNLIIEDLERLEETNHLISKCINEIKPLVDNFDEYKTDEFYKIHWQELGKSISSLNENINYFSELPKVSTFPLIFNSFRSLANRFQRPLTIGLVEIDNLDSIIENYGFLISQDILMFSVQVLRQNLRVSDLIIPLSNNQFVILVPDTNTEGTIIAMKKPLNVLRLEGFQSNKVNIPITFSIGISEVNNLSPDEALEKANNLLNQAKQSGGNKIISS